MPLGSFRLNTLAKYMVMAPSGVINWSLYDGSLDGDKVSITSQSPSFKSLTIDENRVIISYTKSSTLGAVFARILTISDTSISLGTEYSVFTPLQYQQFDSVGFLMFFKVSDTRFCLLAPTGGANEWNGVFLDISGTVISTVGIGSFVAGIGGIQIPSIMMLSSNRAVIAGRAGTGSAPAGARLLNIGTTSISELSGISVSPPGETAGVAAFQFPKTIRISDTRFALQGAIQEAPGRATTIIFDAAGDTLSVVNKKDEEFGNNQGSGLVLDYDYSRISTPWSPYLMVQSSPFINIYANNFKYESGQTLRVTGGPGTQSQFLNATTYGSARAQMGVFPNDNTSIIFSLVDNNSNPRLWDFSAKVFEINQTTGELIGYPPVTVDSGSVSATTINSTPYAGRASMHANPLSEDKVLISYLESRVDGATTSELKSFVIKAPTTSLTNMLSLYSVTPSSYYVNEGSIVTMTVKTQNVSDGTLYWTLKNNSTVDADVTPTSGSFNLTSGTGTFNVTAVADLLTEGAENFQIDIRTVSTSGTIVSTSPYININDTSITPTTFAVAAAGGATSVNEGSSLTFNVTGTNIVNGTYFFTVTNSGDFATSSGSFSITSNAGSFSVTPTADNITEGAETFQAQVRTGSTSGPIVATSSSVTINDTSTNPYWYYYDQSSVTGDLNFEDMVYDSSDNIMVMSNRSVTKYSISGTLQYGKTMSGHTPALDHFNPISNSWLFASGPKQIISIDANASNITRQVQPTTANVTATAATIGSSSEIVYVGQGTTTNRLLVQKIQSTNANRWARMIQETTNMSNLKVVADTSFNIYVTSVQTSPALAQTLHKFSSTGSSLWRRSTAGSSGSKVFRFFGSHLYDARNTVLDKWDLNGNLIWRRQFNREILNISVDANNIYIVSIGRGSGGFPQNSFVTSITQNGVLNWHRVLRANDDTTELNTTILSSIAVNNNGTVLTVGGRIQTGTLSTTQTNYRFLMNVGTDGSKLFSHTLGGRTWFYENLGTTIRSIAMTTPTTPTVTTTLGLTPTVPTVAVANTAFTLVDYTRSNINKTDI
jgi:hypothetical protein